MTTTFRSESPDWTRVGGFESPDSSWCGGETEPTLSAGQPELLCLVIESRSNLTHHQPTSPIQDTTVRWAFDVILTVGASCQFATAAAHADAYSHYPVRLIGSFSRDLQRALDGFIRAIR